MSQHHVFIIRHAVVRIAKKGCERILHKGTTKLMKSANIRKAIAIHWKKASGG